MDNAPAQEKMPITLERATLADIPVLLELEKSVSGTNTYSPILTEHEWQEEFQKCIIYLIQNDRTVIGSLSYEKKDADHAYISGLVINPRFQGKGFGRDALRLLLLELSSIKKVDLVTHPNNTSAVTLYKSLGFVTESLKENYYGDGQPRIVMVLKK